MSLLPRYPITLEERFEPADRRIDWPLVAGKLLIWVPVVGFVALMLFTATLALTYGQVLWLLRGGWN